MEAGYPPLRAAPSSLTPGAPLAYQLPPFEYTPVSATTAATRPASTGAPSSHTSSLDFLLMDETQSNAQQQTARAPAQGIQSPSFGTSQYAPTQYSNVSPVAPLEDLPPPAYGSEPADLHEEPIPQAAPAQLYGSVQRPAVVAAQPYLQQQPTSQPTSQPRQVPQQQQWERQPQAQVPAQAPVQRQPPQSPAYASQGHIPSRPDLQQQPPARASYGYPTVDQSQPQVAQRDPVQQLLETYPNPQTETDKLRRLMEAMMVQFRDHQERVMDYMQSIDQRLANLENDIQELTGKRSDRSSRDREREREREREFKDKEREKERSSYSSALSEREKAKREKKARKKSGRKESKDEEIARKLQEQFNQEAEHASMKSEAQALTDEEYAQKLQALYLKRDSAVVQRGKPKKEEKKKEEEKKPGQTPEDKPSLWSRIFGATEEEDDDDDDKEEKLKPKAGAAKKPDQPTAPVAATQATYPGLATAVRPGGQPTTIQPMPPYAYYPGAPMMVPPGYQYIPLGGGSPYVFQPATGGAPAPSN